MSAIESDNLPPLPHSENHATSASDKEDRLTSDEWAGLLRRIKKGRCTPFIGAGACYGVLPLGAEVANKWAAKKKFPLSNANDLARVAQYVAVKSGGSDIPKDMMLEELENCEPDFSNEYEPHRVLAELPIPIYLTTNYDGFMTKALERVKKKPIRDYCRWKDILEDQDPLTEAERAAPDKDNPLVYHLHGYDESLDSLVLTEDDYLDFLINLTLKDDLIPKIIKRVFGSNSLLFLGYALTDWDFRVVFRWLQTYLAKNATPRHISVQLVPGEKDLSAEEKKAAEQYLDMYFNDMKISVYWGTCSEFIQDLKTKWDAFENDS